MIESAKNQHIDILKSFDQLTYSWQSKCLQMTKHLSITFMRKTEKITDTQEQNKFILRASQAFYRLNRIYQTSSLIGHMTDVNLKVTRNFVIRKNI